MSMSPFANLAWSALWALVLLALTRMRAPRPSWLYLASLSGLLALLAGWSLGPDDAVLTGAEGWVEAATHGGLATLLFLALLDRRLLLAALALVLLGEEVDWGQQFVGYPTPEWVQRLSHRTTQLNFHNIDGTDWIWRLGPMAAIVALAWPPAICRWSRVRQRLGLPRLHPAAAPALVIEVIVRFIVYFSVGERQANETMEASLAVLFLVGWRVGPDWRYPGERSTSHALS